MLYFCFRKLSKIWISNKNSYFDKMKKQNLTFKTKEGKVEQFQKSKVWQQIKWNPINWIYRQNKEAKYVVINVIDWYGWDRRGRG